MEIIMKRILSLIGALATIVLLFGCELTIGETYNNPYAGDWYELEENVNNTWNAVKLSLSDSGFTVSTATFNADGDNPGGYVEQIKGSIKELSANQFYWATKEAKIGKDWYSSREEYVNFLTSSGVDPSTAESTANGYFTEKSIYYSVGTYPTRLIMGSGSGTGTSYTDMTYFTSIFAAKKSLIP